MAKNTNLRMVTLQDFLEAEEMAVGGIASFMRSMNHTKKDEELMTLLLSLIVDVTTKMQGILFGEETECIEKNYDILPEMLEDDDSDDDTLTVIDDEEM